jgi:hypothetical protein
MDLRSHLSKLVATNARNELFLWFGRCEMTLLLLDTQQFEPILLSQFTEGLFEEYSCFTEHVLALENSRELSKIFNAHALNVRSEMTQTPSLRIQQVDKSAEQDLLLGEGEEMFTLTFVYKQVTVEHQYSA